MAPVSRRRSTSQRPLAGYDMLTGARIASTGALPVDFRSVDARILSPSRRAQSPRSSSVHLRVRGRRRQVSRSPRRWLATALALGTIAPGILRISDSLGRQVIERMESIGPGCPPIVWDTARTQKAGTYSAVLTEEISGRTASFSIRLAGGVVTSVLQGRTRRQLRSSSQDQRALAGLLEPPRSPVVDSGGLIAAPAALALAKRLAEMPSRRSVLVLI